MSWLDDLSRLRIVRITSVLDDPAVKERGEEPPKVDPKVTAEEAMQVLRNAPGGSSVIKELERKGKKL